MNVFVWLLHRWLLATVPAHRRCSFCASVAVVYETVTEDSGRVRIRRETRYCDAHFDGGGQPT